MMAENLTYGDVRERYFTVQQVAERLQVNEQTVRRWLREGTLAGVRLAGQWRMTDADVREFIERQRRDAKE
jgi:excisionase family DNA binding protein